MKIVYENLWKDPRVNDGRGLIAVTTNNIIKHDGALVMGGGAAKQAGDHIPGIQYEAGRMIGSLDYGFMVVREPTDATVGFGVFQTKRDCREPSVLSLIERSVDDLWAFALFNPTIEIRLNFPGIGLGGLTADDVTPLLERLPDNVTICRR